MQGEARPIPDAAHPCWTALVQGTCGIDFDLFATRILATRVIQKFYKNPTPENLEALKREAQRYFASNFEVAKSDLAKLGGINHG